MFYFEFLLGIIPKKTPDAYEREIEYLKSQLMRTESRSSVINSRTRAFEDSLSKWRFSNKLLNEYDIEKIIYLIDAIFNLLDPKKVVHFLIVLNKN